MSFGVSIFCLMLLCGIVSVAMAASGISSQDRDTLELPQGSVEGHRAESGTANIHRLNEDELQRFGSLEDALRSIPGFNVREEGGLGGYSELSFRGSDASAVEIYLDGMRLNQEGGVPDLAKWPLLWFSGIEARSGFDTFSAGATGSLARVDLSTQSEDSSHVELHSRIASFSTEEGAATVHGGGTWKWTVAVEGQTAQNDYPFFTDNGTIYNTSDDALLRIKNNAYWSRGARAALQKNNDAWNQTVSAVWMDYRKEYAGIPNTATNPQAYTRRSEWIGAWRMQTYPGRSLLEAGIQAHHFNDSYRDPGQSLGYLSYEQARTATSVEADVRTSILLTEKFTMGGDSRLGRESVEPTEKPYNQQIAFPTATRISAQLGATLREKITGYLAFTEEVRASWIQFDADGVGSLPNPDSLTPVSKTSTPFSARVGMQWVSHVGTIEVLGRHEERAPSTLELLGDNNGIRPNLKLEPQKTWMFTLSHDLRKKGFEFQTTGFWHRYEDPIRLQTEGSSSFLRYGNGATYRAMGAEGAMRFDLTHLETRVTVTAQSLRILEGLYAGNWPAFQSPIAGHAELFWKMKSSFASFTTGPILDVQGPYYTGDLNLPDARRSSEIDLGFHLDAKRGRAGLGVDARNLTDHHYQDFAYSVRSGRSYSLTFSINL